MYKNKEIILLPSEEASHIHYIPVGEYDKHMNKITEPKLLFTDKATEFGYLPMHLYVIDDKEIPYNPDGGTNGNFICLDEIRSNKQHGVKLGDKQYINPITHNVGSCGGCRKIIATTDESIAVEHDTLSIWQGRFYNHYPTTKFIIPQIPTSFIRKYIKSYNKGLQIKNVLVQYLMTFDIEIPSSAMSNLGEMIKVNSINLINIKTQKHSREEVEQLLLKILTGIGSDQNIIEAELKGDTLTFYNVRKWIEQNLNK